MTLKYTATAPQQLTSSITLPATPLYDYSYGIVKFDIINKIVANVIYLPSKCYLYDKSSISVSGNYIYVTGRYISSSDINIADNISLPATFNGNYIYFMIAYNTNGTPLWAKKIENMTINIVKATPDYVYISGYYWAYGSFMVDSVTFPSTVGTGTYELNTGYILKYNSNGTAVSVITIPITDSTIEINDIEITTNHIYITGKYSSDTIIDLTTDSSISLPITNYSQHTFLIQYSVNGTVNWAKIIPDTDRIPKITISDDNLYLITDYYSASEVALGNGIVLPQSNGANCIVKYSSDGTPISATTLSNQINIHDAVATSTNLYICGYYVGDTITLSSQVTLPPTKDRDAFIIKYSTSSTTPTMAKCISGLYDDVTYGIAVANGAVYLCGKYYSRTSITVDNINMPAGSFCFMLSYPETGTPYYLTINSYEPENGYASSMYATNDHVYVLGMYKSDTVVNLGNDTNSALVVLPSTKYGMALIKYDKTGIPIWAKTIHSSTRDDLWLDECKLTVDGDAAYISGIYTSSLEIAIEGNIVLPANNTSSSFIIRYNTVTGLAVWCTTIPHVLIKSISATTGSLYACGEYASEDNITLTQGVILPGITSAGVYSNICMIKYDTVNNTLSWARQLLTVNSEAVDIAADSSGIYVLGIYDSNISVSGSNYTLPATDKGAILMKYSTDGNTIIFANILVGIDGDNSSGWVPRSYIYAKSVTLASNSVYISGSYVSYGDIAVTVASTLLNTQGEEYGFVIKYSNTGTPLWGNQICNAQNQRASVHEITVDSNGFIYTCGTYQSATDISIGNGKILPATTNQDTADLFFIYYDTDGLPLLVKTVQTNYDDKANCISVTENGEIYISGFYFSSTPVSIGNAKILPTTHDSTFMIIKYSDLSPTLTITPSSTSTAIQWAAHPLAVNPTYKLYYHLTSNPGSVSELTLTGSSVTISGLQAGTAYTVYSQAIVDGVNLMARAYPFQTSTIGVSTNPVCFLADAPVLTPTGSRPIHTIQVGDKVVTSAGRTVSVKRVFAKEYQPSASANPYVIPKGMFGALRTLPISPNHEVMTPAGMKKAKDLGLQRMKMTGPFTYYNLELEDWVRDNLVIAGVVCESLAPAERIVMTKAEFAQFVRSRYGPEAADRLRSVCVEEPAGKVSLPRLM